MGFHARQKEQEGDKADGHHDELVRHMSYGEGNVADRPEGEEGIERRLWKQSDEDAEGGPQGHGDLHVRFYRAHLGRFPKVGAQEDEVEHLKADGEERSHAGQF